MYVFFLQTFITRCSGARMNNWMLDWRWSSWCVQLLTADEQLVANFTTRMSNLLQQIKKLLHTIVAWIRGLSPVEEGRGPVSWRRWKSTIINFLCIQSWCGSWLFAYFAINHSHAPQSFSEWARNSGHVRQKIDPPHLTCDNFYGKFLDAVASLAPGVIN